MATTSSNLLLALLALGDSGVLGFDNWGAANTSNLEFLEDAITESSDIAVTSADVTLTDAQHRSLFLNLSGALTGNRSIILKADQKGFWAVKNGTSGAYTVTVKPSGGSGETITQGKNAFFYSDGETAIKLIESSTLDLSGYLDEDDIGVSVQAYDADLTTWAGKTAPSGTVVGTTDTQTLSGKTLTSPTLNTPTVNGATFNNGYTEETVSANTSTAYTIDLANGTVQILTLTGNCTYTFPTASAGKSFLLVQKQDGTGSRTVTWPSAVKWPAGTAPTLTATASKADLFAFTSDGTYWFGRTIGRNYL